MPENIRKQLELINQQHKETDAIYHNAAVRFGLSDCVLWILYALCESECEYTQNDLCNEWFYPKQTINSAINNLVKCGYVSLENIPGTRNSKNVRLTDEGKSFSEKNIQSLLRAEQKAFGRLSEQERRTFLELSEKHIGFLKEEVEKI